MTVHFICLWLCLAAASTKQRPAGWGLAGPPACFMNISPVTPAEVMLCTHKHVSTSLWKWFSVMQQQ